MGRAWGRVGGVRLVEIAVDAVSLKMSIAAHLPHNCVRVIV
eukprot:COSAG01_NODE_58079_length_308_cov_0.846890_1_plen_41_part_10